MINLRVARNASAAVGSQRLEHDGCRGSSVVDLTAAVVALARWTAPPEASKREQELRIASRWLMVGGILAARP